MKIIEMELRNIKEDNKLKKKFFVKEKNKIPVETILKYKNNYFQIKRIITNDVPCFKCELKNNIKEENNNTCLNNCSTLLGANNYFKKLKEYEKLFLKIK